MRFVHVSDTHLGGSNFKLRERKQDFYKAFEQVIDFCVENKPEFVVHSGDLFDVGKPDNETILFAIDQLKRLKKHNIPFLTVPGSHDMSVDGTFLSVLERVGLLINLAAPRYYEQTSNGVVLNGEVIGNAFVCGLPGRRANIKEIYQSIKVRSVNKFKVFLFHHITSNIAEAGLFSDIPASLLPTGMDYYAGGHWHENEMLKHEGKPLVYPGSTDYHNIDSIEKGRSRGFIYYDDKPRFIKLESRESEVKVINCNGLTPEESTNKCLSAIDKSNNGLIILKLTGRLSKGVKSEIKKSRIKNEALCKGCLFCSVKLSNLDNPSKSKVSVHKKTFQEIEQEYLQKQGYSESEVKLAFNLINKLGRSLKPDELVKALIEVKDSL